MIFNYARRIMANCAIILKILLGAIYKYKKTSAHQFKEKIALNLFQVGISL
jgi:hypothetical protein